MDPITTLLQQTSERLEALEQQVGDLKAASAAHLLVLSVLFDGQTETQLELLATTILDALDNVADHTADHRKESYRKAYQHVHAQAMLRLNHKRRQGGKPESP